MDALGLPDPSDYNPPTNNPVADHDRRPATTTGTTAAGAAAQPAQTTTQPPQGATPAPAGTDTTGQDTYPPAPPTVEGVDITESVYQQGA